MNIRETIEWIEVTERLPDDDKTVLVCFADGEVWPGWLSDDQWYSANGYPVEGVKRWAKMPTGEAGNADPFERLLALARQYASECADCNGSGHVAKSVGADADPFDVELCPDCKDIREVIAMAEGA